MRTRTHTHTHTHTLSHTHEVKSHISSAPVVSVTSFKLHQRATHVYSEANRVLQFKDVCEDQSEGALQRLGTLMDESHTSCRDMYECSHPEVDALVQACK